MTGPAPRPPRFQALWDDHHADVLAFVLRRVGDRDTAADIAADTFLVAWRRWDDLPAEPRPWLFGIAHKMLANDRRAVRRRTALTARLGHEIAVPASPGEDGSGDRLVVTDAFNALSQTDREALALTVWEELSPREAAAVLRIPAARFSVRLHRAKQRLRREIERRVAEPAHPPPVARTARPSTSEPMKDLR